MLSGMNPYVLIKIIIGSGVLIVGLLHFVLEMQIEVLYMTLGW